VAESNEIDVLIKSDTVCVVLLNTRLNTIDLIFKFGTYYLPTLKEKSILRQTVWKKLILNKSLNNCLVKYAHKA